MYKISRRKFMKASSAGSFSLWLPDGTTGYTISDVKNALAKGKDIAKEELDTPALVLDLDVFERNVKKMAEACRTNQIAFRPHTKTHKCPEIAKVQVNSGAVGICTAKVGEAEVMANAGIQNVHITSPVVTQQKINRLMDIRQKTPGVMVVVDNHQNVNDLSDAALSHGFVLNVLVDINPLGHMRTGSPPGQPAVDLAKSIVQSKGLRLRGIQSYAGGAQHIAGFETRRQKSLEMLAPAVETKEMMIKEGLPVEIFTGGGSGTYNIDYELKGFTDVQVGSYIFMDVQYLKIGGKGFSDNEYKDFESSLTVVATAISKPTEKAITIDAGYKAFSTDGPKPLLKNLPGYQYNWGGDEHGILTYENPERELKIGDRVEAIIPHCDPTVNLYDNYFCVRNGKVEDIWAVAGRGKCQ